MVIPLLDGTPVRAAHVDLAAASAATGPQCVADGALRWLVWDALYEHPAGQLQAGAGTLSGEAPDWR